MSFFIGRVLPSLLASLLALATAPADVSLDAGDTIVCYGNSMVERLCEHGELEAMIQLAQPAKNLRFRSFAWTGDEVGYRLRPEGYEEHMKSLLRRWPAAVVIAGFGMNESFAGRPGLEDFRKQLAAYLDQLARFHPQATLVLLAPTAVEAGGPGPDAAMRNGMIGRGDRSERIRTYNYPQGRWTDHRINLTLYKLNNIMEGDLGEGLLALRHAREAELLADLEDA